MWHAIFHLDLSVAEKVLRSILIYAFLVVALRVVGKRELGQANTLDLVVLLLVANAVQNGIIGNDNSVTGALIGAVTLFVVNEALNRTTYAFPWVERVVEGNSTVLIQSGRPMNKALFRAGISLPDLRAIARRQGFDDLGKVHTAILETNGVISMFSKDEPQLYHPAEPGGLRIGKRRRTRND
ncbi:MAG TPA: YetF domain-containing protein [Gaiellaceae bacterium]|nr:YetF domain-containing protein [Gaiellaceae bacterium]